MTTRWRRYGYLALAAGCHLGLTLHAQPGRLTGPVAGFVYDDAAHAVRPVQGVPGASVIGAPVNFGLELASAYVSPRLDCVIVIGADHSLHLFRLNSGAVLELGLPGIDFLPQRVVFSPSGTAAALIDSGVVKVLQGLPDVPVLAGTVEFNLPRTAVGQTSGRLLAQRRVTNPPVALSDDGNLLLYVDAGSLWLSAVHGENHRLMPAEADAQAAFAPGAHDAALVDRLGLTLIHDASGAAAREMLASPDESIALPVGLAFSQDGRTIYVASSTARGAVSFDLNSGSRRAIPCDCVPTALVPMGSLFRLNELRPALLWLLDAGAGGPRIVFVPAPAD
jgi:hypothetical protein